MAPALIIIYTLCSLYALLCVGNMANEAASSFLQMRAETVSGFSVGCLPEGNMHFTEQLSPFHRLRTGEPDVSYDSARSSRKPGQVKAA